MGQFLKKLIENFELLIDINAKSLKASLTGLFDFLIAGRFWQKHQSLGNNLPKFSGRIDFCSAFSGCHDRAGNDFSMRFIGIFHEQFSELIYPQVAQALRC
ncbi:hypothetical protein SDC9_164814 [bioreactor metagenome]|uniref:Uncharacterized protein n=1 Tax=bioreactor metagenome TaxID=1076179 RepID=A0A645FSN6_9ZZZZ